MHPLIAEYKPAPVNTSFCGPWHERSLDGVRVSFAVGRIYAGSFNPNKEQITVVYLSRYDASHAYKENDAFGLKRWLPVEALALDSKFHFGGGDYTHRDSPRTVLGFV